MASGAFWGLGVLAKSFLILSAFAIVAVWIHDRFTVRRISARGIMCAAVGGIVVLGLWQSVLMYYDDLVTEEISVLYYYRHYLMFGLSSTLTGLGWFSAQPVYSLSLLIVVFYVVPQLFLRIPAPSLRVLLFTAELYLFWWLFFTPATIFRYMWYSCAIVGIFSGPLLVSGFQCLLENVSRKRIQIAYAVVCACILVPCGQRFFTHVDLIYVQDQAADERSLAAYLRELPDDASIATGYWPAILSIDRKSVV